jgi:hypothetical protein
MPGLGDHPDFFDALLHEVGHPQKRQLPQPGVPRFREQEMEV